MKNKIAKARTAKRLLKEGFERHVKQVFSKPKPVVFIAGKAIEIDAEKKR